MEKPFPHVADLLGVELKSGDDVTYNRKVVRGIPSEAAVRRSWSRRSEGTNLVPRRYLRFLPVRSGPTPRLQLSPIQSLCVGTDFAAADQASVVGDRQR